MVHNPIYEGPLYETLETRFDTLTAVNSLTDPSPNTFCDEVTNHLSNPSPNRRYVERPRHTCSPQNQPSLSLAHLSSATVRDHSEGVVAEGSGNCQENGNVENLDVLPDMDEKYITMTQGK